MTSRMTQDGRLGKRYEGDAIGIQCLGDVIYNRCVVCYFGKDIHGTQITRGYKVAIGRIGMIRVRRMAEYVVVVVM